MDAPQLAPAWRSCAAAVESALLKVSTPRAGVAEVDLAVALRYASDLLRAEWPEAEEGRHSPRDPAVPQSTRVASALLFSSLAHLAGGHTSVALRHASLYVRCRPGDAAGGTLLATLTALSASAGVREGLRALLDGEASAHLLLHPLCCPACCGPLRSPVTDRRGVTRCLPCDAEAQGRGGGRAGASGKAGAARRASAATWMGMERSPRATDTTVAGVMELAFPWLAGGGGGGGGGGGLAALAPAPTDGDDGPVPAALAASRPGQAARSLLARAQYGAAMESVADDVCASPACWPGGHVLAASILASAPLDDARVLTASTRLGLPLDLAESPTSRSTNTLALLVHSVARAALQAAIQADGAASAAARVGNELQGDGGNGDGMDADAVEEEEEGEQAEEEGGGLGAGDEDEEGEGEGEEGDDDEEDEEEEDDEDDEEEDNDDADFGRVGREPLIWSTMRRIGEKARRQSGEEGGEGEVHPTRRDGGEGAPPPPPSPFSTSAASQPIPLSSFDTETAKDVLQWARECILQSGVEGMPGAPLLFPSLHPRLEAGVVHVVPQLRRHILRVTESLLGYDAGPEEVASGLATLAALPNLLASTVATTLGPLVPMLPLVKWEAASMRGRGEKVDVTATSSARLDGGAEGGTSAKRGRVEEGDVKPAPTGEGEGRTDAASLRPKSGSTDAGEQRQAQAPAPDAQWSMCGLGSVFNPLAALRQGESTSGGAVSPLPPRLRSVPLEDLSSALDCPLCFNLLYQPVTLPPCQHTLCKECLIRCLDHKPECPTCRCDLSSVLASHSYPVNGCVDRVVRHAFPDRHDARRRAVEEERREADLQLPIFVCDSVLPGATFPLHIFEPRYRLMFRRAMASGNKRFGMTGPLRGNVEYNTAAVEGVMGIADGPWPYAPVGVAVKIESMALLPDGRSLVLCTAEHVRFKVVERGMRDAYQVGKVEWLVDSDTAEVTRELLAAASPSSSSAPSTPAVQAGAGPLSATPLADMLTVLVGFVDAFVLLTQGLSGVAASYEKVVRGFSLPTVARYSGGPVEPDVRAATSDEARVLAKILKVAQEMKGGEEGFDVNPLRLPDSLHRVLYGARTGIAPSPMPTPEALSTDLNTYLWAVLRDIVPLSRLDAMAALKSTSVRGRVAIARGKCGALPRLTDPAWPQVDKQFERMSRLLGPADSGLQGAATEVVHGCARGVPCTPPGGVRDTTPQGRTLSAVFCHATPESFSRALHVLCVHFRSLGQLELLL